MAARNIMQSNLTDNELFNKAVERANSFTSKPASEELLKLYGLYKQATVGDVAIDKPGIFDLKGRHKWDAWNSNKGVSKVEAQAKYVALVEELAKHHG